MKLKESIYQSLEHMDSNELIWLHEQIKLLEQLKNVPVKPEKSLSIEKILEMTSSSQSCWSDAVIEERADRL